MSIRIGYGYDSHEFKAGVPLVIGGVSSNTPTGWQGIPMETFCCTRLPTPCWVR